MPEATSPHEPARFDPTTPNVARMYDYYLGGKDNFAADREAAEMALSMAPELRVGAQEVRRFLRRAVTFLVREAGIRQFIDVGCGLPTRGNVHEIAQAAAPDVRVAYVDNDPVVAAHARALLESNAETAVIQADMREPAQILDNPVLNELIDLRRPVAVLLVSVLHILADDDQANKIVARFREAMAPGSYLVMSHAVSDMRPETTAKLAALYQQRTGMTGKHRANLRTRAEVEPYFDGLEMVEPGLVYVPEWRPDPAEPAPAEPVWAVGGIARKA
jgi:O-methyltransferase involved in polyketide biosynthesis